MRQDYNFSAWEPRAQKSLVPDGDFKVRCTGKRWAQGDGQPYIQLDLIIFDPDYAGLTLVGQCTSGVDKKEGKPLGFIPQLLASYYSEQNPNVAPDQITMMVKGQSGYDDDCFVNAILYVRTKRGTNGYEDRSDVSAFIQRATYEAGCVGEGAQRHGRRDLRSLETAQAGAAGATFNPAGSPPRGLPKGAAGPGQPVGAPPPQVQPPVAQPPQQQYAPQPAPQQQYAPQQQPQQPYQAQPQYAPPVQQPQYMPPAQPQYAPQPQPQYAPQPQAQPQYPQQPPPQMAPPLPMFNPQHAPPQHAPQPQQQPAPPPQYAPPPPPQGAPPGGNTLEDILRQHNVVVS